MDTNVYPRTPAGHPGHPCLELNWRGSGRSPEENFERFLLFRGQQVDEEAGAASSGFAEAADENEWQQAASRLGCTAALCMSVSALVFGCMWLLVRCGMVR